MPIIKKSAPIAGKKLAILAPVKKSYFDHAISQIFPIYKKVSFGTDKVNELKKTRELFLMAMEHQGNVYVYFYVGGAVQYKATLLDGFLFFNEITPHSERWGKWNKEFKSYYTVEDINPCSIPLSKFTLLSTNNVLKGVPERPLRVIDPQ